MVVAGVVFGFYTERTLTPLTGTWGAPKSFMRHGLPHGAYGNGQQLAIRGAGDSLT